MVQCHCEDNKMSSFFSKWGYFGLSSPKNTRTFSLAAIFTAIFTMQSFHLEMMQRAEAVRYFRSRELIIAPLTSTFCLFCKIWLFQTHLLGNSHSPKLVKFVNADQHRIDGAPPFFATYRAYTAAQRHHTKANLPLACSHAQNATKWHLFYTSVTVFTWGGNFKCLQITCFFAKWKQGLSLEARYKLRVVVEHIVVKDMFRVWLCTQPYKRMENRWGYLLVCARVCSASRERYPTLQ